MKNTPLKQTKKKESVVKSYEKPKPKKKVEEKKEVKKPVKSKPVDPYKGLKDAWGNPVGGEGTTPPFSQKRKKK